MAKAKKWLIGGVMVAGLLATLGMGLLGERDKDVAPTPAREEAQDAESLPTVNVVVPQKGGLERQTTQPGTVRAYEYEDMYARVPGYLTDQMVDIGSRVKKGDLLARIDAPELLKEVDHATALVEQADAQVKEMEAQVDAAKARLDAARQQVLRTRANVKRDEAYVRFRTKEYKRIDELAKDKAVDFRLVDEQYEHLDAARGRRDASLAAVDAAGADVKAKEAEVEKAGADLIAARANADVARAALGKAKTFADFTEIRSHYDGVVTARNYHNGDYIQQGDRANAALLTVQRTDKMRIIVQVPDMDVPYVKEGDPADLLIGSLPNEKFQGLRVSLLSHSEDVKTRTMRVELHVENARVGNLLKDGMYGDVTIHMGGKSKDAWRTPSSALSGDVENGQDTLLVVRAGKVHRLRVVLGADNGKETEILKGLHAGDLVVAQFTRSLAEGTAVRTATGRTEQP